MYTCRTIQQDEKSGSKHFKLNTYLRHVAVNPLGIGQDVIPQNQASSQGLKKVIKPKHNTNT